MLLLHFAFQMIILAVGFGVGYWILINASNQESFLRNVGQTLGTVLIVLAAITTLLTAYYSLKEFKSDNVHESWHCGCPLQRMIQLNKTPMVEKVKMNDDGQVHKNDNQNGEAKKQK